MVAAIVSAIVVAVSSLLLLLPLVAAECVVQWPANGSRDVHCDAIPFEIDLSRVADDPAGITRLDVSGNDLTGLRLVNGRADRNLTVVAVDLSRNRIPCVCRVTASSAVRVESIVLSFNAIRNFSTCTAARNLTLRWNRIEALRRADMVNASAVQVLDLAHNRVLWIENDTFAGMPDLQWLDLGGNALTRISDRTLPGGRALRHLDVSENRDLGFAAAAFNQPFENLVELSVAGNADLAPLLVVLGSGPRLQALDASRTNLTAIPVTPAPLLGRLVLSGNAITAVNGGDLDGFPLLRLLNISRNRIGGVEDDAFGRLDLLTVLDLSGNLLTAVPRSLPRSLETLDLADNRIPALAAEDFDGCKRLRRLNLAGNRIGHVQDFALAPLVFLDLLDLSDNPIAMITREMLTGPVRLTVLKMERIEAEETPAFPFTDTRYLKRVHLAHSPRLAAVLLNDTAVLSSVSQLEHLDLTGCAVPDGGLPERLPYYAPKMKTLIVDRLQCTSPQPTWLLDWLCEIHRANPTAADGPGRTELRIRNYRLPEPESSPVDSVRCVWGNDSRVEPVFDRKRCAAIVTTTTTTQAQSQAQAVFARLRAKDPEPPGGAIQVAATKTGHPGMVVFGCVVLLLVGLAAGTVWIGVVRGDALKRLHWKKQSGAADVDYQSIEIKSLESLNHVQPAVERW